MKIKLVLASLLCIGFAAFADPCTGMQDIQCNTVYSFVSNGPGDPLYPAGMNGQGCSGSASLGGQEFVYRFAVPATGTYQININSASVNGNYVGYYFKRNSTDCNNTGWTCFARNNASAGALAGFNWEAGDTILLLLNAESASFTSQSFSIGCAVNICDSISEIACGDTAFFIANGYGNPLYPNGMNGQGCSPSSLQGGQESIYRFIVPVSGTYQVNNIGASVNGNYVGYYYRINNSNCTNTGWNCFARNNTRGAALGAFNWNAGDTVMFLLNAEATGFSSQSFTIGCAVNFCDSISDIACGDTAFFTANGYGNPLYPNGMNGQGCSPSSLQGGQESMYRFIVPVSGTYQVNNIGASVNGNYVGYYYRINNGNCTNTGWNCFVRNNTGGISLGAFNWNAGDTVMFLLNAEATGYSSQSFTVRCAVTFCDSLQEITLADTARFTANGYGNPLYPNGMNGQGCSPSSSHGGQEQLYRFRAPVTASYQLKSVSAAVNGNNVGYYYKVNGAGCSNTGWTCLARNGSAGVLLGSLSLNAGDTVTILLNAESIGVTSQSFRIICLDYRWAGIADVNWNTPANWLPPLVPVPESNVIIPAATPFSLQLQPVQNVSCRSLYLLPGAVVELLPGANITVNR